MATTEVDIADIENLETEGNLAGNPNIAATPVDKSAEPTEPSAGASADITDVEAPATSDDKAVDTEQITKEVAAQNQAAQEAQEALTAKGVDYNALVDEYADKGALSEQSYEAMEKAGFPKGLVDAFIAGQLAVQNQFVQAVYTAAGGQEEYGKMINFIQGKSATDVKAFNALVDSGNLTAISMALNGVKAEMVAKYGTSKPTNLGGSPATTASGYGSPEEMYADMGNEKYGIDAKFTEQVQAKLSKSDFIKFNSF